MKVVRAKVIDARHLELVDPLPEGTGRDVELSLLDGAQDEDAWKLAALRRLEDAYAPEDAIYEKL
jgi:hypothetical protein